jgi:DNA helicase HerA-like ATPase
MIVTNKSNLEKLAESIKNAKKEIFICSAWIRAETLNKVFTDDIKNKIRSGEIDFRMIIRLGKPEDISIDGDGLFSFIEDLGEKAKLKYHKTLHAKMYVVDDSYAMLGSFNLTGGGFGTDDRPGSNPETGVEYIVKKDVKEVKDRFLDIWNNVAREIENDLIGFVLNPANNDNFIMVGVKELEANKFVEVRINETTSILGKITKSQKHNIYYYGDPNYMTEFEFRKKIFEAYSNVNSFQGLVKGLVNSNMIQGSENYGYRSNTQGQLNIAYVNIISQLNKSGGGVNVIYSKIPPDVASEVYDANKKDLETLYNNPDCSPAVMIANENIEVGLDPEEIATKHLALFGSTGSGKSYFAKALIAKYLKSWMCDKNKGRIIIFDTHGEYTKDYLEGMTFYGLKKEDFKIINTDEIKGLDARLIKKADDLADELEITFKKDEKSFIDEVITKYRESGDTKAFLEYIEKNNSGECESVDLNDFNKIKNEIINNKYAFLDFIDKISANIVKKEIESGALDKKEKESKQIEYTKKLFDGLNNETQGKITEWVLEEYLYSKIKKHIEESKKIISETNLSEIRKNIDKITFKDFDLSVLKENKIYIIDYSNIHDEYIRQELTANIIKQIFENKKERETKKEKDTIFVIEEAHNFAPEGAGKGNPAGRILKQIASEGRKFRLGLIIITQRPAYVAKDVLAQCSTQAIFRLINNNDLAAISDTVEGISKEEIARLPNYETGQAIFTGVAIRQPVIVKIKK